MCDELCGYALGVGHLFLEILLRASAASIRLAAELQFLPKLYNLVF